MLKTYRVYFSQVNQTFHEVNAHSEEHAILQATREWKRDNKEPSLMSVSTTKDDLK